MEMKTIWKHAIDGGVSGTKELVKGKIGNIKDFTSDHPEVTGVLIALVGFVILESIVIDAADKVIEDLGGWD